MSDLISRQAVKEQACMFFGHEVIFANKIDLIPSADRPTGEWKSEELANMICDGICYYKEVTVNADRLADLCEACWLNKVKHGRPTGRWVRKEKEINDCDGHRAYYWYECDNCGARPPKDQWGHEWHSDFCPNCGAKMEGGEEE